MPLQMPDHQLAVSSQQSCPDGPGAVATGPALSGLYFFSASSSGRTSDIREPPPAGQALQGAHTFDD